MKLDIICLTVEAIFFNAERVSRGRIGDNHHHPNLHTSQYWVQASSHNKTAWAVALQIFYIYSDCC